MDDLKRYIRDVPDFPIPGILFKDITTLLKEPGPLAETIRALAAPHHDQGIELVAGVESRGFMFGMPLALALGAGFVPVRKPGKLPAATLGRDYALEYGVNRVEIHQDAIRPGQRVLLVDDLLATGGTAGASAALIEEAGGLLHAISFVIELAFLKGRERLSAYPVYSLLRYD